MVVSLTIVRYRKLYIPFALLAMALHRIPLCFSNFGFWKLMGCGKNGTFDLQPDWQQWALLITWKEEADFDRFYKSSFIAWWWRKFTQEQWTILCAPFASHGKWDGKQPFDLSPELKYQSGPIAVLTRATIRFSKLKRFWSNVKNVANVMSKSSGYITSFGIGEAPFFLQATFSIWENMEDIRNFAYKSPEHSLVIKQTRDENWYSEELFARFIPLKTYGHLNGQNPLHNLEKS
ncbi:MAG: hypothetical protein JWN56_2017 [Sphingobacteriales bacterium]|nr:hypothetical protein [Sphingobacteriales bacterium]